MTFHYVPPTGGTVPFAPFLPLSNASMKRSNFRRELAASANTSAAPPKAPRPLWIVELEQSALRLRDLKPGWDGPGSGVVAETTIRRAVALVQTALKGLADPAAPYLVPAGDGSLQIEWHRVHGELEFCLEPDGSYDLWGRDHRTGQEFEGEGSKALALFRNYARWVAGKPSDAAHVPVEASPTPFGLEA